MFFEDPEREASALHDEALRCIDARELDRARAIAARLRGMRWSGAFEIEALAARAEGDLEGAIGVLEEGARLAPRAWSIHLLLGSLLDVAGRSEEALASLDRALACPGAWAGSVLYNRAVTRLRAGDPGGALADAEAVLAAGDDAPFVLDAVRVAIDALHALRRTEHALALVETVGSQLAAGDERGRAELAGLEALAAARHGDRARAAAAIDAAIEARAARPERIEALALLATSEGPAELAGSVFRVTQLAPPPPGAGPEIEGALRVVEVRARDEAQAIELARALEPRAIRGAIAVEEIVRVRDERGPACVLHASGAIVFGG